VVVDKPAGMTSHDVVDRVRRALGERRVGHAGTLDPDATGVLVLGVGSVTRLLTFLTGQDKAYSAEVVLGVETSTLDASGTVTARHEMAVDVAEVRAAATRLTGEILQVPPMVSAVHVGGRRLHELAREGVEVEREPRPVRVDRFDVEATADPLVYRVHVRCSAGTYVRSLAADLGHLLGGGAHLRLLRRTASGRFTEADCCGLDALVLRPPADAVAHLPAVVLDAGTVERGQVLDRALGFEGPGPWVVLDASGEVLAVYEVFRGDTVKPAVVLVPPPTG
jgi:tRNA pseudouridine55 synthase